MRTDRFHPEFVETMPERLEPGVLYISIRFRTVAHLCACGCGSRVVTPVRPAKWSLVYDGDTVSLWPSVGSWQLPCKSHYVIRNNDVRWERTWTEDEIARGRARDQALLRRYYDERLPEE